MNLSSMVMILIKLGVRKEEDDNKVLPLPILCFIIILMMMSPHSCPVSLTSCFYYFTRKNKTKNIEYNFLLKKFMIFFNNLIARFHLEFQPFYRFRNFTNVFLLKEANQCISLSKISQNA